jgi:hypothetical protein
MHGELGPRIRSVPPPSKHGEGLIVAFLEDVGLDAQRFPDDTLRGIAPALDERGEIRNDDSGQAFTGRKHGTGKFEPT